MQVWATTINQQATDLDARIIKTHLALVSSPIEDASLKKARAQNALLEAQTLARMRAKEIDPNEAEELKTKIMGDRYISPLVISELKKDNLFKIAWAARSDAHKRINQLNALTADWPDITTAHSATEVNPNALEDIFDRLKIVGSEPWPTAAHALMGLIEQKHVLSAQQGKLQDLQRNFAAFLEIAPPSTLAKNTAP